ncbi:hypothetical protein HWB76_gp147 [Streptomyces phage Blueeyedbeauty]|uniref:Uncharacterized protein n=1 Tax=Streptomyces phage Blueeyedbeauty TaxID=2250336 RepID=A0A345L1V3_9CAUD|nr:hypothetical protein HWB76_gp147 [Streptomyces phage Blueeyedbeauty]AXH49255.1 hypothetical protein SEA_BLUEEYEDBEAUTY_135 [Streptomyces phage Blueeyedbeauty]
MHMSLRVGQQIVVAQFVRKGIEYSGRKGFVEIAQSRGRITVLLYKTDTMPECTIDMHERNVRTV